MNVIEIQDLVSRLYQQAQSGKTVYAVCPMRTRNALTLALLSQMRGTDAANGKTYNVGKGLIHMVRPADTVPADKYAVSLVGFSEADGAESKGMLTWRDKAEQVIA